MNSRERMLAAINHEPYDRVPTDIWATGEVWQKLQAHFGAGADIQTLLHIDGMAGWGRILWPALPEAPANESVDFWGIRTRRQDYGTGAIDEQCAWPLAGAVTIDDLERYAWPSADWFDYSEMRAQAQAARERQVVMCGYMAPFYFHNLLRGLEQSLVDPLDDAEFTHHLLDRLCDYFYTLHLRMFGTSRG